MTRSHILRAAGLFALACLTLTTPGAAQTIIRPSAAFVPKFEVVAETRLIMEGLANANYRGLQRQLRTKPTDNETWTFARGQAILIAESGNLMLLRPPRNTGRETWMKLAMSMRTEAGDLARAIAARDYTRSRLALVNLTIACNRCHTTFRVPVKIGPEKDMGERDTE